MRSESANHDSEYCHNREYNISDYLLDNLDDVMNMYNTYKNIILSMWKM